MLHLTSNCSHDTFLIGKRLGSMLSQGDSVCLYGELGAGKTVLIKGIAVNFNLSERDITSASFTIISEYESETPFYHVDLYRLDSIESLEDIGLYDYFSDSAVIVIEWADRARGLIECAIEVFIKYIDENRREISIKGIDEKNWNYQ